MYFLIKGPSWVVVTGSAAGEYTHAAKIVNQAVYYSLLMTGILSAVMLVVRIARLIAGGVHERPDRRASTRYRRKEIEEQNKLQAF